MTKGGSTNPLFIKAIDSDNEIKSYVVKVFNENAILQNFSTAKEIVISELCDEFDLVTPNYGVIDFDNSELRGFFEMDYVSRLSTSPKFCSEVIEGVMLFDIKSKNQYINDYDIGKIFAFDSLIINADRGGFRNKSNLLVNNEELILIDHELTIPFYSSLNGSEDINYWNYLINFSFEQHVFYKYLKRKRNKDGIFDEFEYYLNNLNLNIFEEIFNNLESQGIDHMGYLVYRDYFEWAKNNSGKIMKILYERVR